MVDSIDEIQALTDRRRLRILEALREPDTAAGVARLLDEPRQRVNYHVTELARVGLLERAGERRKGNFVEQLYRASARTLVLSPRLTWGDEQRRDRAIAEQGSLDALLCFGAAVQSDAAVLLDRAAFGGQSVPSASVQTTIRLSNDEARNAFLQEYLDLMAGLVERYASSDGPALSVGFVTYPVVQEDT